MRISEYELDKYTNSDGMVEVKLLHNYPSSLQPGLYVRGHRVICVFDDTGEQSRIDAKKMAYSKMNEVLSSNILQLQGLISKIQRNEIDKQG